MERRRTGPYIILLYIHTYLSDSVCMSLHLQSAYLISLYLNRFVCLELSVRVSAPLSVSEKTVFHWERNFSCSPLLQGLLRDFQLPRSNNVLLNSPGCGQLCLCRLDLAGPKPLVNGFCKHTTHHPGWIGEPIPCLACRTALLSHTHGLL